MVFSQPHFLDADPAVINAVTGVHPNREEHSTIIDVEPVSFIILYTIQSFNHCNILHERIIYPVHEL